MTVYFTENYRTPWCFKINIKYKKVYFQTWNSILTFKTQVPYEKPYNKIIPCMGMELCYFGVVGMSLIHSAIMTTADAVAKVIYELGQSIFFFTA